MKATLLNNVGKLSMATSRRPTPSTCFFSQWKPSLVVSKAYLSAAGGMKLKSTVQCTKASAVKLAEPNSATTIRRSGNYKPTTWDFEYIQSVNNRYVVYINLFI